MSKCMYRSIIHNLLKTETQFGNLWEAKDLNASAMREYLDLFRSTTTIYFLATKSIQSSSRGNLRENALIFFQILSTKKLIFFKEMYGAEIGEFVCWSMEKDPEHWASLWVFQLKKKNVCHVAAAWKRSHQWCISLTPNNTKTIGRMTCHCFLRPIRRDLTSSSYTTHFLSPTEAAERPFYVVIWATQDGHFMRSSELPEGLAACNASRVRHFTVILRPWVLVHPWESNLDLPPCSQALNWLS